MNLEKGKTSNTRFPVLRPIQTYLNTLRHNPHTTASSPSALPDIEHGYTFHELSSYRRDPVVARCKPI